MLEHRLIQVLQRGIDEFSRMNLESRLLQRITSESIETIIQKADIVLVVILYEIWLKQWRVLDIR